VRWQLLLSLVVIWGASSWLKHEYGQDDSNLWLVMSLFGQIVKWTLVGLLLTSLLSVLFTWAYFIYTIKNKQVLVSARLGDGQNTSAGWVPLTIMLTGSTIRPLLGSIQARLIFSEKRMSESVILDGNIPQPRHWWRQGIKGSGQAFLHDRGVYDVEKILVSFYDMLGLLSLPYTIPFTQQLFTLPKPQSIQKASASPNSTEEQKQRIEIPKRVEGEYVNYKEFEAGDNIQRIVWKIYAKSGQLVVRIPETKDPYASHLYFYASFFHGFENQKGAFELELLNVYKDKVRNLYEALLQNGYEVRIPQDQEVPKLAGLSEKKNELFQITAASWQSEQPPSVYVNYNKAAFVCVSSLTPIVEVESLLRNLPLSVPVIVIKLSEAIPSPFLFKAKDILFKPEKQPSDHLRQPWMFSSLRRALIKNEKELAGLLKQRGNSWVTNAFEIEK
ncbi:MAG: DUF58 domain-containing protein, partial [Cyclobacteriaceae bacterium]|nr:DUF58 domain-containing protein [Cyclobacteriaceae bacterium]